VHRHSQGAAAAATEERGGCAARCAAAAEKEWQQTRGQGGLLVRRASLCDVFETLQTRLLLLLVLHHLLLLLLRYLLLLLRCLLLLLLHCLVPACLGRAAGSNSASVAAPDSFHPCASSPPSLHSHS